MSNYQVKVIFLDEDGYKLEAELMTVQANSPEEAYDIVEEDVEFGSVEYPSDEYEIELVDVY